MSDPSTMARERHATAYKLSVALDILRDFLRVADNAAAFAALNVEAATVLHIKRELELAAVRKFAAEVDAEAERAMLEPPHKLEGQHKAAMVRVIARMQAQLEGGL